MKERYRRRLLLALGGLMASPRIALAQKPGRVQRICWLSAAAPRNDVWSVAFIEYLRKLGFVEGNNLHVEFRSAGGDSARLPELAADLARQNCDAFLVTGGEPSLVAVKQATRNAPIIILANDYDPVATGHAASFARPGGRVTGVYAFQLEVIEKRLELVRELLPQAKRIGVLADVATVDQLRAAGGAANRLGVELYAHVFKTAPYDYEAAFADFARARTDALLPLGSGFFVPARKRIVELAVKHRLPGVFNNYVWTELGGLMSYGTNFSDLYRRAADQMAKVLRGANPADLPLERATVIELVLNMKTAKALSLSIPQGIWFRADRVIE
jgi:putative ABC transport system substrate-binding protein